MDDVSFWIVFIALATSITAGVLTNLKWFQKCSDYCTKLAPKTSKFVYNIFLYTLGILWIYTFWIIGIRDCSGSEHHYSDDYEYDDYEYFDDAHRPDRF